MLPSTLFIAFWALLAVALFFVAVRGGPSAAREALHVQSHRARNAWGVTLIVVYIGFGVVLPLVFLTGNHSKANAQIGGVKLNAAQKSGRELFGQHCGICHTLQASNSVGKVGPDLDQIQPSESLTLHTIKYGCLQHPSSAQTDETCLGQGTMPATILQGKQAQDVAQFVARVAGKG
jgi:mono/diheme cytochrome c family protein